MVYNDNFTIQTTGCCDVHNITEKVEEIVQAAKINNGQVLVFVTGSTASITTMEVEAELDKDLKESLEIIAPEGKEYHHDKKWQDGNGFSHIRSTLIGTSQVFALINGELLLGTWQQIVLCDFDNKKRDRLVTVQILGE
ncbi:MAG TPA: YjbQ family protein [Candidatus Uhrbacteria bacterium]|nr:YjbQ family protein [Candidatus Uhrbacteria bacterium]